MTKEIEQIEISTFCPICNKAISEIWIAKLDSVIGIRYAYICWIVKICSKYLKKNMYDTFKPESNFSIFINQLLRQKNFHNLIFLF